MLKIKRTVIGTMLVSSLLISGCDNQVGQALSSGQQSVKQANYTEKQINSMDHGFVAYYFVNNSISPSFSIPFLETNLISGELAKYHDKKVTSMIAKTQLIVNKTGKYKLLTNQSGVSLSLNGANVSEDGVNLQAQQAYELALSYKPNDGIFKDIKLQWVTSDYSSIMDVPVNNLLFSYQGALNQTNRNRSSAACNAFGLTDTSCNGIPDEWAIHGYTVFTNPNTGIILLEKWDDILHGNKPQYTRYFSAVYKYSTADDPYSDYQKVTGIGLDKGVSKDARNPLIAAVPIIYAKSEGVIISKNTNITTDINGNSGKSVSISTSNSATDGSSDDVGGSLSISPGISIFPPNISVNDTFTAKYDHQWNHSQTLTQGKDSSGSVNNGWSTSLNMNNADAAYFLPIMRYENIGTAPVYDLAPTFTFMEPKQKLVLTSVTAKSNSIANSLLPNTAYPKAGQPGILISGNDDFNSQPAKLNKTQLDALEKNKIFTTYVNQFTAKVKFFNSSGQPINLPDFDNSWEPYLTQSGQTTAQIKLFTPDNQVKVRKIAARDPNIPQENLSKPEVLLADALAMIGGIRYNQATKKWEIIDEDGKVTYEMAGIEIFSEPNTMKEINKQLFAMSGSPKDLGKIKLRAKIQLTVCPKGDVFKPNDQSYFMIWSNCQATLPPIAEEITLTNAGSVTTKGYGTQEKWWSAGFLVAAWSDAKYPAKKLVWEDYALNPIEAYVINSLDGKKYTLKISARSHHFSLCSYTSLHAVITCQSGSNRYADLEIKDSLNSSLPKGIYKGSFDLLAKGWHDPSYVKRIKVNINFTTTPIFNIFTQYAKSISAVLRSPFSFSPDLIYIFLNDGNYLRYSISNDKLVSTGVTAEGFSGISSEQAKNISTVFDMSYTGGMYKKAVRFTFKNGCGTTFVETNQKLEKLESSC